MEHLIFELPPSGVWLLTGENGCGKTTLLGALRRIGFPNAFAVHFPASQESDRLDDMSCALITYSVRDASVTYRRKDVRWVPQPKSAATVLKNFGYAFVEFIGATSDRLAPREEDFIPNRIIAVPRYIIQAANRIFATDKFSHLRYVNVSRGINRVFVFARGGSPIKYSSEKSFSLGELCVLKLLKKLEACPHNGLFLIDELEMALHPAAQIRLLRHLEDIAAQKNLTVIFSTHSVSLIKTARRDQILHLRRTPTGIECLQNPFASVVLGDMALAEERTADIVFFVEDELAAACAEPLMNAIAAAKLGQEVIRYPSMKFFPVGGFQEVVNFLQKYDALTRPGMKGYALLDQDVLSENVAAWKASGNHERLAWLSRDRHSVKYLPWTPEVGIFDRAKLNYREFEGVLRSFSNDRQLYLPDVDIDSVDQLVGSEKRAACKRWLRDVTESIRQQTNADRAGTVKFLGSWLAREYLATNRAEMMRAFGSIF